MAGRSCLAFVWLTSWFLVVQTSLTREERHLASTSGPHKLTNLHIGGLFPISGTGGWQGGQGCLPAARMALNDVNAEPYLLPGYRLVLHWNDSQVSLSSDFFVF